MMSQYNEGDRLRFRHEDAIIEGVVNGAPLSGRGVALWTGGRATTLVPVHVTETNENIYVSTANIVEHFQRVNPDSPA